MNTEHARAPIAVLVLTGPPSSLPLPERARSRVPLVEVRLDLFEADRWASLPRETRKAFPRAKLLATLRLDRDGGRWPDSASRLEAMRRLVDLHRWDFLDIEDDAPEREELLRIARDARAGIVLSRHAFVPQNAEEASDTIAHMLRTAAAEGAAVAKWAARLEDSEGTLPGFLRQVAAAAPDGPVPAIFPMGPLSETGRVAAALASGGWGYAHDGSGPAAPGQVPWPVFEALLGSIPPPGGQDPSSWLRSVSGAVELALAPVGKP